MGRNRDIPVYDLLSSIIQVASVAAMVSDPETPARIRRTIAAIQHMIVQDKWCPMFSDEGQ